MERYANYVRILSDGGPAPLATIAVHPRGEPLVFADIFDADGVTPKANPFTADVNAYFFFLAANGRYDIALSGGGIVAPYTWADILLSDTGGAATAGGVQTLLGGSRFLPVDIVGNPETVDAVDWFQAVIPAESKLPAGTVITAFISCKVAPGSSVVLKLRNTADDTVFETDPTPFVDDTQFVEHQIVIPAPATQKVVKLSATVTDGAGQFVLCFGDIRYEIVNP